MDARQPSRALLRQPAARVRLRGAHARADDRAPARPVGRPGPAHRGFHAPELRGRVRTTGRDPRLTPNSGSGLNFDIPTCRAPKLRPDPGLLVFRGGRAIATVDGVSRAG